MHTETPSSLQTPPPHPPPHPLPRFCDKLTCEYRRSLASGEVLAHPAPAPSHFGYWIMAGLIFIALAVGCCCLCLMGEEDEDYSSGAHYPTARPNI